MKSVAPIIAKFLNVFSFLGTIFDFFATLLSIVAIKTWFECVLKMCYPNAIFEQLWAIYVFGYWSERAKQIFQT